MAEESASTSTSAPVEGVGKREERPITYFDIAKDGQVLGRVVFELYSDLVPKTVENFRTCSYPSFFSISVLFYPSFICVRSSFSLVSYV